MESELGLDTLAQTDRQVLATIVLISNDGRIGALLDDIKNHNLALTIPTASLYRSKKSLIQKGMVRKAGSQRSGISQLA